MTMRILKSNGLGSREENGTERECNGEEDAMEERMQWRRGCIEEEKQANESESETHKHDKGPEQTRTP